MKFIAALLLTMLLAFIAGLYLPWWSIAIAAFVAAILVKQNAGLAWLTGFLALFLLWVILAWMKDGPNESLLSTKIAALLKVGGPVVLLLLTGLIGGLVAGFAAMTGSFLAGSKKKRAL